MLNIDCEVCGKAGAKVVTPACGGTAEMCGPCHRQDRRQAEIDARAYAAAVAVMALA